MIDVVEDQAGAGVAVHVRGRIGVAQLVEKTEGVVRVVDGEGAHHAGVAHRQCGPAQPPTLGVVRKLLAHHRAIEIVHAQTREQAALREAR